MIAYLFPGQGSQQKGMGKGLFEEFPDIVSLADRALGYSIKELCLEDPEQKLGFTEFTQPAIFTVNSRIYLKKQRETGILPDYVAGHSLGEYNALFASGAFTFETGLNFEEVSSGRILTGMVAKIQKEAAPLTVWERGNDFYAKDN